MPIFTNDDIIMRFVKTAKHFFQKKTQIKLENQNLTELRNFENYRIRVLAHCGWDGIINRV